MNVLFGGWGHNYQQCCVLCAYCVKDGAFSLVLILSVFCRITWVGNHFFSAQVVPASISTQMFSFLYKPYFISFSPVTFCVFGRKIKAGSVDGVADPLLRSKEFLFEIRDYLHSF